MRDVSCFHGGLRGGRCTKVQVNQTNLKRVIFSAASSASSGGLRHDVNLTSTDVRPDVTVPVKPPFITPFHPHHLRHYPELRQPTPHHHDPANTIWIQRQSPHNPGPQALQRISHILSPPLSLSRLYRRRLTLRSWATPVTRHVATHQGPSFLSCVPCLHGHTRWIETSIPAPPEPTCANFGPHTACSQVIRIEKEYTR